MTNPKLQHVGLLFVVRIFIHVLKVQYGLAKSFRYFFPSSDYLDSRPVLKQITTSFPFVIITYSMLGVHNCSNL